MDIQILTDDAQRASWYFDAAGRETGDVLRELHDGIQHYFDTHGGDDKLPETLCGAVCATLASVILYDLAHAPEPRSLDEVSANIQNLMEAGNYASHSIEHADAMAVEVFTPQSDTETVSDVLERLTSWVLSHLPESDPDAFLASLSLDAQVSEG